MATQTLNTAFDSLTSGEQYNALLLHILWHIVWLIIIRKQCTYSKMQLYGEGRRVKLLKSKFQAQVVVLMQYSKPPFSFLIIRLRSNYSSKSSNILSRFGNWSKPLQITKIS